MGGTARRFGTAWLGVAAVVLGCLVALALPASPARGSGTVEGFDASGDTSWITWQSATGSRNDSQFGGGSLVGHGPGFEYEVRADEFGRLQVSTSRDGGLSFSMTFPFPEGEDGFTPGHYERTLESNGIVPGPSVRVEDARSSCDPQGSFIVDEYDLEQRVLAIRWAGPCSGGARRGSIGEIRIGLPADPVRTIPAAVDLLSAPVGGRARPVAVVLQNTSDEAVDVADVDVVGDQAVGVRWSECGRIAAGSFCRAYVSFAPRQVGGVDAELRFRGEGQEWVVPVRGLAVAQDSASSGASERASVRPAPAEVAPADFAAGGGLGRSSWRMHSQEGSWVGEGRDHRFEVDDFELAGGTDGSVTLGVDDGESHFRAVFSAPGDGVLVPGERVRVTDTREVAQLDVGGDHRACGGGLGEFRVLDSTYSLTGLVRRLVITFSQHCRDERPRLLGTIALRPRTDPPNPPGYRHPSLLEAESNRYRPGREPFVVSGRLSVKGPQVRRQVILEKRAPRAARWRTVARPLTSRNGSFRQRMQSDERVNVRVRFPGSPTVGPSKSQPFPSRAK